MTFRRALLPALLAAVLYAPGSAGAQNALTNPSFENGSTGWAPVSANLRIVSGGPHGSKHARAVRRSGSTYGLRSNQAVDFARGQRVRARASVRAPRGKQICIRIHERAGSRLVASSRRCVASTGRWQRPAGPAHTVRRAANRIVVTIVASRTGSGNRLDVDNVVLRPAGAVKPRTVIRTTSSWECRGALRSFGRLPIKVISRIPNPGTADAIRLIGCYGNGDPKTVDLILDVRGNGRDLGTGYDAVKIGQSARDLVVTGQVACGARHGGIHQDVVQAMSGRRIKFVDFRSGQPARGKWTCWGAGGGWYVSHANGNVPTNVVCVRCRIATYNQNMRIDNAIRSGARNSVFGYSRSHGIFIGPQAVQPVNVNNKVIRY